MIFLPQGPAALVMPGHMGKGGDGGHRATESSQCKGGENSLGIVLGYRSLTHSGYK